MLARFDHRICTFCALDFEPRIGSRFEEAADHLQRTLKPASVHKGPISYAFLADKRDLLVTLAANRLHWQTLGISVWTEGLPTQLDLAKVVLKTLEVTSLKRVGFKVVAFLPLEMRHPEMSRLMFGSFLAPLDELGDVLGEANDSLVHFEGSRGDWEYLLDLAPQTGEQAKHTFLNLPSVGQFVREKFARSSVSEYVERLAQSDCFFVDTDLYRKDVGIGGLTEFLTGSVQQADVIADAVVARLQSKPISKSK